MQLNHGSSWNFMQHSKQWCVLHWYKWYSGLDGFHHFFTPVEPITLKHKNRLNSDGAANIHLIYGMQRSSRETFPVKVTNYSLLLVVCGLWENASSFFFEIFYRFKFCFIVPCLIQIVLFYVYNSLKILFVYCIYTINWAIRQRSCFVNTFFEAR